MSQSEPTYAKNLRGSKGTIFYLQDITPKISTELRNRLETHSGIPPEDVTLHVHQIRDQAWAIRAYPCIGLGAFARPNVSLSSAYKEILESLELDGRYLDIGCLMGHDLRQLVWDGVPPENCYGIDIVNFWDLGKEMFRDGDRFNATYIETDILAPCPPLLESAPFRAIGMFLILHQWAWEQQVKALVNMVRLASRDAIMVGMQWGRLQSQKLTQGFFSHDLESFQRMWREVEQETITKWEVECAWRSLESLGRNPSDSAYLGPEARMMEWVARRRA